MFIVEQSTIPNLWKKHRCLTVKEYLKKNVIAYAQWKIINHREKALFSGKQMPTEISYSEN